MGGLLGLILLTVLVGLAGWAGYNISLSRTTNFRSFFEESVLVYLCGFGVVSVVLFLLAITGLFHWWGLITAGLLLVAGSVFVKLRRPSPSVSFRYGRNLLFCLLLGICAVGLGLIVRPYEAFVSGNDASIYLGASLQLEKTGALSYQDPLIVEMHPEERQNLFRNRFAADTTGPFCRFPGGVRFLDLSQGLVTYSFYHLFPAWLGFGIKMLGETEFLSVMNLFSLLTMIVLFWITREVSGTLNGVAVVAILLSFFMQLYFSQMPVSELLGQMLFLAGLAVFISGIDQNLELSIGHQRLVGLLWGTLILTRLDALFTVPLCLLALYSFPRMARKLTAHRAMITYLSFFALLAFYYQMKTGDYFQLLTLDRAVKQVGPSLLWILDPAIRFVSDNPVAGTLAYIAVSGAFLCMLNFWILKANSDRWRIFRTAIGVSLVAFSLFSVLAGFIRWDALVNHYRWLVQYIHPAILVFLLSGVLFLGWEKGRTDVRVFLLIIFLLVPFLFYFIRPLSLERQPWALRRFVPWVFPLFFCLSLSGWWHLCKALLPDRRHVSHIIFMIPVVLMAITFVPKSAYLVKDHLFLNVMDQLKKLAPDIPSNALVVVPDSMALTHLQIAVQYLLNRDTILAPLESPTDTIFVNGFTPYLERTLQRNRPVIALLHNTSQRSLLLQHFMLTPISNHTISFRQVPFTLRFPAESRIENVRADLFLLGEKPMVSRSEIHFNDPDVRFVNFHDIETGHRWTTQKSEIKGFTFSASGKSVMLVLSMVSPHPVFSADQLNLCVLVNGSVPATFINRNGKEFYYRIDASDRLTIRGVTITSRSFVPAENKINADRRRLGISFVRLRFTSLR